MLQAVCPGSCNQSPLPCSRPLLTCTSAGDPSTCRISLYGVSGSWYTQGLFEPSENLWWVWGLILNMILALLPSCWGFSFALGRGVCFFGGIQHSPGNSCLAAICNFGVLTGEDECKSFYSAILPELPDYILDNFFSFSFCLSLSLSNEEIEKEISQVIYLAHTE